MRTSEVEDAAVADGGHGSGAGPGPRLWRRPVVRGLIVGVAATAATVAVRLALDRWLGDEVPLLPFVIPVLFASRSGGRVPGFVTSVLAGWISVLLFVEPRGGFPITEAGTLFWFVSFIVIGGLLTTVCSSMRDAVAAAQRNAAAARAAGLALQRETEARRETEGYWLHLMRMNVIGTGVAEPEGAFHEANDALLDLLGCSREDLRAGRVRWADATPAEYRPLDREAIRECAETGACRPYEKEYLARGGGRVPVLQRFATMPGSPGSVALYVVDLSRQKQVERELRANEARLRLVLDAVADYAIYTVDLKGTITTWNSGSQRVTGFTPQEAIGSPVTLLFPPQDGGSDKLARELETALATGRAEEEGWRMRHDGTRFWANVITAPLRDADGSATGFVKVTRDLTERRHSEMLLQSLLDNIADGVLLLDEWGRIRTFSHGAERIFVRTEAEVRGSDVTALMCEPDRTRHAEHLRTYLDTGETRPLNVTREVTCARGDGTPFPAEMVSGEFYLDGRRHFTVVIRDVTERRKLEDQLRQSQKMEAVGRLAGGVAHDFNNLLTVINGYSEMLRMEAPEGGDLADMARSISEAGQQAAGLTRQLLAFSRRAVIEPRVLDLNDVVRETDRMLRRVIGEDVHLETSMPADLWPVRVDAGQTAQVLMNLAINARDAMPRGGSLTLQTSNVTVDTRIAGRKADLPEGRYVLLAVHDTGHGMSGEVQSHLFEPFFTTKPPGEGTGLGLATVYGIVKQSGGHVDVYSEVGVGTTFKIYLPALAGAEVERRAAPGARQAGGSETILLVEDDERVREVARSALHLYGYRVIPVSSGAAALQVLADPANGVDLVVSDVIMPEMSGPQMAERASALRPHLRTLFVSGYTDDTVVRHGILSAEMEFLQKPYTPRTLAQRVREVLDKPPLSDGPPPA
jgi:two-component system cell cycle sensor histidine kinase/response regulator CckA